MRSKLCAPLYNRLLPASLPSCPASQSLQWCIASGRRNPPIPSKATLWNVRVTVEKVTNSNHWLQIFSQVKWCWFIALNKVEGDVNYLLIVIFRILRGKITKWFLAFIQKEFKEFNDISVTKLPTPLPKFEKNFSAFYWKKEKIRWVLILRRESQTGVLIAKTTL